MRVSGSDCPLRANTSSMSGKKPKQPIRKGRQRWLRIVNMKWKAEDPNVTEQSGQPPQRTIFPELLPEHIDDRRTIADIIHILNVDALGIHRGADPLRQIPSMLHQKHRREVPPPQTASTRRHIRAFPKMRPIQLPHHPVFSEALPPRMVSCSLREPRGYLRVPILPHHRLQ